LGTRSLSNPVLHLKPLSVPSAYRVKASRGEPSIAELALS
jgi:hypothetical protein